MPFNTQHMVQQPQQSQQQPQYQQFLWLILYFLFSLCLTIYNKMVMQLLQFPFPWLLTALHTFSGWLGCRIFAELGLFKPARLTSEQRKTIRWFSVLYTLNIAASNISLNLVTVPFHQVVRALVPIITMFLSIVIFAESYSKQTYISLIPIVLGVPLATLGDYSCSTLGLIATLFGAILASLKTIGTNKLQSGPTKFHPLDMLYHMSLLAFAQCISWALLTGEIRNFTAYVNAGKYGGVLSFNYGILALCVNGALAFSLNYVSFTANGKTSPLMMCVAGNMKQVMSIILSIAIFDLHVDTLNSVGIALTLVGGAWYTSIELRKRQQRSSLLHRHLHHSSLYSKHGGSILPIASIVSTGIVKTGVVSLPGDST